jgi:signal transduction histidine kinase
MQRNLVFRPRARLISVLGEHLISDQAVALVELIKNAYDADARHVSVEITGIQDHSGAIVVIADDGTGMTLQDIETRWLSPAADEKERAKIAGERTALGRLPIGEKGVGRFAVHQLGRSLEMVTRAAGNPEYVVLVDWDSYDQSDGYLDDIKVEITERQPVLFIAQTGTCLTVRRPRSAWDDRLLRKVHRALRRLQSPLRESEMDFAITFRCPTHPELEEISPTDILRRAHYQFRALVDETGTCDYEYSCRHPSVGNRDEAGSEDLLRLTSHDRGPNGPRCGPFWLNLYVWDRTRDALAAAGVSRRELDALSGVSLYRDGLRVFPYGEPGDDWLFLDQDRIQAPAERIGNNQVIGLVEVDQSSNLRLRDKTNREGLIENDAFLDLRALSRAAIRSFTTHWRADRPSPSRSRTSGEPSDSVAVARRTARALRATARDDVAVELPPSMPRAPTQPDNPGVSLNGEGSRVVNQREAVDLLIGELDEVQQGIHSQTGRFERLLQLAATGLAAERVVHEFGRQLAAASEALRQMRSIPGLAGDPLTTLTSVFSTLEAEFRILAPYETTRRAPRARQASIRELAVLALRLNNQVLDLNDAHTEIIGDDFLVRARGTQVLQILDNLIYNAAYWVTKTKANNRRVAIIINAADRAVMVADNGPGVTEQETGLIFEPFFSMKEDGSGLGLYISAELAKATGGTLRYVAPGRASTQVPDWAIGAIFELKMCDEAEQANG